jgi:hypothetical protein
MSISFSYLSDAISFSTIQTVFDGALFQAGVNPISLSEYLIGASAEYVIGTNIPSNNINQTTNVSTASQISVLNFYNKYNFQYDSYEYIVFGDKTGSMSETGGTIIINLSGGGTNKSIGTVGFPFFWFGTDYGSTNNIQWNTDNAITFGGGSLGINLNWKLATTAKSFLIGTVNGRYTQMSNGFPSNVLYNHNIKRFIVKAADSSTAGASSRYELDINLIRGPFYQYIELKIVKWSTSPPNILGIWNISDGIKFYNPFKLNSLSPPVGTDSSLVLRGSLKGTDWVAYPNYHMNIPYATFIPIDYITISLGIYLVFRLDGINIDGSFNTTLTGGGTISSWYNSGKQAGLTTTQTDVAKRPTYNTKGGVRFTPGKFLLSTIDLSSYPKMNIFFVWKNMQTINLNRFYWNQSINYRRFMWQHVNPTDLQICQIITSGTVSNGLLYQFPYNTTVVINCEYDWQLNNLTTRLYINNNYKLTNISTTSVNSGAQAVTNTYFGAYDDYGSYGIDGIIYEIIVIKKTLTEFERTNIYKSLEIKWGPTLYNDNITSMGSNLVYRISGNNIDYTYNDTLIDTLDNQNSENQIKYWYNSGNNQIETVLVSGTQQKYPDQRPIFIGNGVLFSNGTAMYSPSQYIIYPKINIFVVWKKTAASTTNRYLWSQFNGGTKYNRTFYIGGDTSVNVGYGNDSLLTITYTFPLYATTVVNCEYNSTGLIGKIYINNNLLGTFNNTDYLSYSPADITYGSQWNEPIVADSSINGIIYEIIIINRLLSDTERDNIYNFLNVVWGPFYTDAITSMGDKLVLRLDGYNIDGKKNTTLTSGTSTISWWLNSGHTYNLATVMQWVVETLQPTYNTNGVEFLNNSTTVLITNVNFNNYPIMNIFLVFKKTVNVPAGEANYLWASSDATSVKSVWLSDNYLNIATGGTGGTTVTVEYTFPIGETFIINCEYNTNSSKMYIDNKLKKTFSVTNSSSADVFLTCFGNISTSAPIASSIKGIFYEIIIINKYLLDIERTNIYNCLNNKWDTYFDPMGTNLILRHDGKNIDGTNNSTLTSGTSTISSWFNSGNVASLTTTQTDVAKRPTYTNNSAVFNTVIGLVSTIALYDYQIMNIFIVWSLTTMPDSVSLYTLFTDELYRRYIYIQSYSSPRIRIGAGYSETQALTAYLVFPTFFPLNTTVIYNLEYNLVGQPANFYINNILKATFTTQIATNQDNKGAAETYFGFHANYGYNLNGNIYEIIIINRILKTNERTNTYNFLKTRWNVP